MPPESRPADVPVSFPSLLPSCSERRWYGQSDPTRERDSDHRQPLKILLYSHDSFGLGHFRRSTNLANAIARRAASAKLLLMTGSPHPGLFSLPAGADFVKMPSASKDGAGSYVPRSLGGTLADLVALRRELLVSVASRFRPDAIVVDHAPLGLGRELVPLLRSESARGTPLLLGMRDVLDAPDRARLEMGRKETRWALERVYDRILVYGHKHVCDVGREYGLSSPVRRKLEYVGVACEINPPPPPTRAWTGVPRVLVTAGGGEDAMPFLSSTLNGLAAWSGPREAVVVTGPLLADPQRRALKTRARSVTGVRVKKRTRNMGRLLMGADVVVCRGGYNSVYEALRLRKRVLVCPRTHPRREQWERAERLAGLGLATRVTLHDLDVSLEPLVKASLERTTLEDRSGLVRFNGAEIAAGSILEAAGSRSRAQHELAPVRVGGAQ